MGVGLLDTGVERVGIDPFPGMQARLLESPHTRALAGRSPVAALAPLVFRRHFGNRAAVEANPYATRGEPGSPRQDLLRSSSSIGDLIFVCYRGAVKKGQYRSYSCPV